MKKLVFISVGLAALSCFSATSASSQEISTVISKYQFVFDQQALFQQADKNADRIITSNEISTFRLSRKSDKTLESKFNELDTDLNGFLSRDEVLIVHERRGAEYLEGQQARRDKLIKKFDLDSNGEISSYEIDQVQARLKNGLNELPSKSDLQSVLSNIGDRQKTHLDTNSDGFVSEDELLKLIKKSNDRKLKFFRFQKNKLIKQFDLDKNGNISATEIDKAGSYSREKWIESRRALAVRDYEYKDSDSNNVVSLEEYKYSHQRAGSGRDKLLEKGTFISRDINDDGEIRYTENEAFLELLFKKLDIDGDGQLSVKEQKTSAFKKFQKIAFSKHRITQ